MIDALYLFSSDIERQAALPDGAPQGVVTDLAGVGLIDAGIGTTRAVDRHRPDAVVYLGTAGAFHESGLAIGDIVVVHAAVVAGGDAVAGAMRFPTLLATREQCDDVLSRTVFDRLVEAGVARIQSADAACTLGVTERDDLARALGTHSECGVENLEAFAVMRAAGVPVAVVLGVTNIVGEGGGSDWAANYRRMMGLLGAALLPGTHIRA